MGLGADPDDDDENPDVWQLFRHYDALYFRGVLIEAGFSVEWSHPRTKTTSSFGSCSFGESNTITLYEPILKYRTNADLKNALLHLMIHAFLSVKHDAKGIWCHGPAFRDWMDALNTCSIEDRLRPTCGYCITTTHDFSPEKCGSIQGFLWKCGSCGFTLLRAKKLGPPSDSCCIENVSQDATCGNMLCNWHNHKLDCDGTYVVTRSPETPGQQMVPKGRQGFLTEMSKMLKSQGAAEESDSDEVPENFAVAELIAESKLVSQVGGRNARSPGSSFSKEASKSNMPLGSWNNAKSSRSDTSRKAGKWQQLEHAQKSSVKPSATQKKVKLEKDLCVPEKYGVFSLGSCNNAKPSGSSMSRKTEKWIKREGVEKSSVPLATPLKNLKLEHDLVHKHGGTKPLGNSTGNKEGRLHKPEGIQKASVIPAAPPRKRKQDLVASEKNDIYSFVGRSNANVLDNISSKNAHKQGDLATPLNKLKLGHDLVDQHGGTKPLGGSTGNKVGKLHKPEGIQKATVLPAAPPRKLKLDLVASEKNDISSFVGRSNADVLDNISKNAHKQGDLATPLKKQKHEHDLVDQHGGTKPLGGSTGNKVGKLHKPEGIQKTSVLPAAPPRRLKQDLVASEKKDFSSFVGRSNANVLDNISSKKPHKQREHEDTWKPIARPPAPQSILKQQSKTNSSTKAGKQQIPECFQKTFIQPAASQSKPKRSNHVAPGRPKTRSKTSNPARKKEYACVSVWANIYESECSSGSAEPLVNKRTERRKRARERSVQITYSRSRKRSASGISPIKAQPAAAEDEISSQQGKPPPQSQCLQFILIDSAVTQDPRDQSQPQAPSMGIAVPPADKVKTQTPRGHSQLPAQCMDIDIPPADLVTTQTHGGPSIRSTCIGIATVPPADHVMTRAPVHQSRPPAPCSITTDLVVPPHSADPPSLTPLNPSSSPDVIDISDDD